LLLKQVNINGEPRALHLIEKNFSGERLFLNQMCEFGFAL
jgi:hypothetical protein